MSYPNGLMLHKRWKQRLREDPWRQDVSAVVWVPGAGSSGPALGWQTGTGTAGGYPGQVAKGLFS